MNIQYQLRAINPYHVCPNNLYKKLMTALQEHGILAALLEVKTSGQGQVVDAAMSDGSALLMSIIYGRKAAGHWNNQRENNLLDGGAHFYASYECSDNKYIAVGAIEARFYQLLLQRCQISDPEFIHQYEAAHWPSLREKLARL